MLVAGAAWGSAVDGFTVSAARGLRGLVHRALTRGLSLSEWGLEPAAGEGTVKEKAVRAGCPFFKKETGCPYFFKTGFCPLKTGVSKHECTSSCKLRRSRLRPAFSREKKLNIVLKPKKIIILVTWSGLTLSKNLLTNH